MDPLNDTAASLEGVAHIIQVALTPVFLLAGLANLLAVFSTRLGRVSDKVDRLTEVIERAEGDESDHAARLSKQLTYLVRRSATLDVAVVLGSLGGVATCASVLVLLIGYLWDTSIARALFIVFGAALVFTLAALIAFVIEMLMAGRGLRAQARLSREIGAPGGDARRL